MGGDGFAMKQCSYKQICRLCEYVNCISPRRGELSYLAPLGSENISAPYFKQCFFGGGGYYPPDSQTPRLPVPRQK